MKDEAILGNPRNEKAPAEADWLDASWIQQGLDALKDTLDVSPELKAQMIEFLFEAKLWNRSKLKTWEAAISRFNACLNPTRNEKFSTAEIWALMHRFERYALFFAICDDLGFERPRRISTESRRQETLERLTKAVETTGATLQAAIVELRRLEQQGAPVAKVRIHPAALKGF